MGKDIERLARKARIAGAAALRKTATERRAEEAARACDRLAYLREVVEAGGVTVWCCNRSQR